MTKMLLKLFVKNYENTKDPAVHSAIGKLAGVVGIICNCLLTLGKLITGIVVGSVSIVADAVNNISDAASSVVTLLGFRLAQQPADKDHPYGHARYEYLSGLIVSAMILVIGVELAKSSIDKIINPVSLEISFVTILILVISILVKVWMSVFFKTLGKKIDSTTLIATSADSKNDVIATSAVLLGCLINFLFNLNIDGYVGLIVAGFIIYSGIGIAKDTISPLLGKQADKEFIEQIEKLILSHNKILGIHDLLIHDYGPGQCYASVHVEMNAEEDPLACHDIIDDIEWELLEKMNVHLVIHYDPVIIDDEEQNKMYKMVKEIVSGINPEISVHDFRIVKGIKQSKLTFDLSVPYSMIKECNDIKQKINDEIFKAGKKYITVIRFDGKA